MQNEISLTTEQARRITEMIGKVKQDFRFEAIQPAAKAAYQEIETKLTGWTGGTVVLTWQAESQLKALIRASRAAK